MPPYQILSSSYGYVIFRRKVSHGLLPTDAMVKKEDYTHSVSTKDVTLLPGLNRLTLQMKVSV